VVPHPELDYIGITDCEGSISEPVCSFCAGAAGTVGDDPCGPTATETTTWGAVKSLFR
jgi:hypothetical protein